LTPVTPVSCAVNFSMAGSHCMHLAKLRGTGTALRWWGVLNIVKGVKMEEKVRIMEHKVRIMEEKVRIMEDKVR
jgi:hypothetical protein